MLVRRNFLRLLGLSAALPALIPRSLAADSDRPGGDLDLELRRSRQLRLHGKSLLVPAKRSTRSKPARGYRKRIPATTRWAWAAIPTATAM